MVEKIVRSLQDLEDALAVAAGQGECRIKVGNRVAVEAIHSDKLRNRILQRIGLLDRGPGLHKARPTASWGTVYLFTERPFVVVY